MMIAVFNNLPELVLGLCWTCVVFTAGRRWERRKTARLA